MKNLIGLCNACYAQMTREGVLDGLLFLSPLKRIYDNDRNEVFLKWFTPSFGDGVFSWQCKWNEEESCGG